MNVTLVTTVFFILISVCGVTDVLYGKIFNSVTLPAFCLGLLVNGLSGGISEGRSEFPGLEVSVIGAMVGFVPLYIIYRMGGMGAGDVKLMAGIGSLMGFPFVVWALFYSILVGGCMATVELIRRGTFRAGLVRTYHVLLSVVVPGLEPMPPDPFLTGKIPFGLAIALGSLWAWVDIHL